jgi:hypothetical protein
MKKVRWIIVATVFLLVATVAVTLYVRQYYLSMRDAKPVLEMLKRGTPGDLNAAAHSIYDGLRLKGPGANRVRQAVLRDLAITTDKDRFFHLVGIIIAGTEGSRLMFRGEAEWDIIKAAVDRSNARPGQTITYTIATGTNGVNWLSFHYPMR